MSNRTGVLYIVATPIGNLGDMGARAIEVLGSVDLIAAEDTRHTRKLLNHYGIATQMMPLHEHNERERHAALVNRLVDGTSVALVSDAGTPLVSDPGFRVVRAARSRGVPVVAVPGPCAAIAALSIAGLPTDRFVFEGFLPARTAARVQRMQALTDETRTLIFYVTPRQLRAQLLDAAEVFGPQRQAAIARELTKAYESFYTGTLGELLEKLDCDEHMQRGELVLLINGAEPDPDTDRETDTLLSALLDEHIPLRSAVDITTRVTGKSRNSVYQRALELKRDIDADKPLKE